MSKIILPNLGCRNLHLDLSIFFTISQVLGGVLPKSRCTFLHLDFGNTEVVPSDLGKNMFFLPISGCRNLHVDLGNGLTIIFYHDFSRNGFGVLHFWDLGKQKTIFSARGTPNPSPPQIRRITIFYFIFYRILSKYSTKKNISELRSNWWSFVLTGTSTSRRVNGWRG